MLISENWLREWVNPKLDTRELADKLTMAGLEVDHIAHQQPEFSDVFVGQIKTISPHPNSDRLQICKVDYGAGEDIDIICGAANVAVDMKTAVAIIGAKLPGGLEITQSQIRNVVSSGMLCSASELGLIEKSEGILELEESAQIGLGIGAHLSLEDQIIDIEITPNRGDCLSVAGVAREVCALTAESLTQIEIVSVPAATDTTCPVEIVAKQDCPRYTGRVIEAINPSALTPDWMKEKLRRSGIRPINAVVDITSFVMIELGQPMHAFDLDRIDGGIIVRQAKQEEVLTLLDGKQLKLNKDDLLICDHQAPIALAGIMGGLGSGISDETHTVFLESAYFSQTNIIGKARRLGIQTDASYRFERGVDPCLQEIACERATALLVQVCGGKPGPLISVSQPDHIPVKTPISLRFSQIDKVLGIKIAPLDVMTYLKRLECRLDAEEDCIDVMVPAYRFDLEKEHDLIEEIARLYGYENIPANPPVAMVLSRSASETKISSGRFRNLMVDRGFHEVISYSFVDPHTQAKFHRAEKAIELNNPMAENLSQMRLSLVPGLLAALAGNYHRQHRQIQLMEIGNIYFHDKNQTDQQLNLACISTGIRMPEQWSGDDSGIDFYDIKADVEALYLLGGRDDKLIFKPDTQEGFHPGRCAKISLGETPVGMAGQILPSICADFDVDQEVYFFQLNLELLGKSSLPVYYSVSKYPSTRRDLSLIVDRCIPAANLLSEVELNAGQYLQQLKLFDVYMGKPIDCAKKSVSLGLTFQAFDRTLTERELDDVCQQVLLKLDARFGAKLRV